MKVGDRITKTWEVKHVVESMVNTYTESGRKYKVNKEFALIENNKGQQRVLRTDKKSVTDAERMFGTFSRKFHYTPWDQFISTKNL